MHEGHRQRMYERLTGKGKMEDHELLEMLLYPCLPRINTNEIAHRLLDAFGNLPAVFQADEQKLLSVDGIGKKTAKQIFLFGKIMERIGSFRVDDELPMAFTYESFSNYLRKRFAKADREYVEIYGIKAGGQLIFCKRFTSDEIYSANIPAGEIAGFIANFKPRKVILVHNHVQGDAQPSPEDDEFTKRICLYFSMCDVEVVDHCIVTPKGIFSYKMENRMEKMQKEYSFKHVLGILQ